MNFHFNYKSSILIALLVIFTFASLNIATFDNTTNHSSKSKSTNDGLHISSPEPNHLDKILSYTDHNPISITGNSDFSQQALNEGWLGNGTPSNPYIIENYRIVNNTDTDGIYILSTTVNYIIRNNYISMNGSTSRGIYVASQPSSGTISITGNILDNNTVTGLYLYQQMHTIISNNSIINNRQNGVNCQYSQYLTFSDNLISGNGDSTNSAYGGITGYQTTDSIFSNNNISSNYRGIALGYYAQNNTFIDNFFYKNQYYGLDLEMQSTTEVLNNIFLENSYTPIYYSSFITPTSLLIQGNTFQNTTDVAIWIADGENVVINNNTFLYTSDEVVRINGVDGVNFTNNYVLNDDTGSGVHNPNSANTTLTGNTIIGGYYGFRLSWSDSALVQNNYIVGSTQYGIEVAWGQNNLIRDNMLVDGTSTGFDLFQAVNVTLINNTVMNFVSYGIAGSLSGYGNYIYLNNFLHNNYGNKQANLGPYGNTTVTLDNGSYGNFWLDLVANDTNLDGILESTYSTGSYYTDQYPLSVWYGTKLSPEILSSPSNITYETHSTGHYLVWNLLDENPGTYNVFVNGASQGAKAWSSRILVNFSVNAFNLGVNNVTFAFQDADANEIVQSIFVTVVDTVPPNITVLSNVTFMEGATNSYLNWTFVDFYPYNYTMYIDGVYNQSGLWNNNNPLSVDISYLLKGNYNFTMVVQDTSNNVNVSKLYVTIYDGTPPVIDYPANTTYEYGFTGNSISWTATDNYPANYTIYRNGSIVSQSTWSSGSPITISVDGLNPGIYEFLLIVQDTSDLNQSRTIFVQVTPDATKPTISSISDFTINENDTNILLGWTAHDLHPTNYNILLNGSSVATGPWTDNVQINYIIADYTPGIYNYTIIVYDISGLQASNTVFVTVQAYLGFFVTHPGNVSVIEGYSDFNISWSIGGNSSGTYVIFQNSIEVSSGSWINNKVVDYTISSLSPSTYNLTIVLNNTNNVILFDTVYVDVNADIFAPTISTESNLTIYENTQGHSIQWSIYDNNPNNYQLWIDGSLITTMAWPSNNLVNVSVDGLSPGIFNYTLVVFDTNGLFSFNTVFVYVIDNTAPVLVSYPTPVNINSEYATDINLSWQANDYSPNYYIVYLDGNQVTTNTWSNSSVINVTLSGLHLGSHNVTIIFIDNQGLSSTKTNFILVEDTIAPTISTPTDLSFQENTNTDQIVSWSISDQSNGTYQIYLNGLLFESGTWSGSDVISVNVKSLQAGSYNMTIIIKDFSNNMATDQVSVNITPTTQTTQIIPPTSTVTTSTSSSTPVSSSSSIPTSNKSSTSTITASPGFEFLTLLGIIFLKVSFSYRRRKNDKN